MKKIISLFLIFVLLFCAALPAFAAAESPAASVPAESEDNGLFFKTVINNIRDFFKRFGAFFRELFGNRPIDVPAGPLDTITAPDGSEMHLVWNDEFNSDSLDGTKWTLRAKMNQSDIRNGTDEHNVKVENGELVMRSWKEDNGNFSTNTSVTTDGTMSYKYGYLEMFANVPFVEGCWPSFWMQSKDIHRSVPYMTEIDIFEVYDTRNIVAPNIHKWYSGDEHYQAGGRKWGYKFRKSINLNNEYHLYGFGWTPDEMYFTVDGEIYFRYDLSRDFGDKNDGMQGFNDPVYIIFNNFIFTENSSWKNPPVNEKTEWPITYKIDWIRLYQKDGEGEIFDDTGH